VSAGSERPEIVTPPPGPRSRALSARLAAVESPAFDARRDARAKASGAEQAPIVYASAIGSNVVDADGNRYVDLVAGFGALLLGHRPAEIARRVDDESAKLWLALGDVYASEAKVTLCERLAAMFPEPNARVMLGLSGADAVTAALKTAALATGKSGVVAFHGAYHGLSYAPLAACGLSEAFRAPFAAQLNASVAFAPYPSHDGDLDRTLVVVRDALRRGDVGAVLVEPILGRGGCIVPPRTFLAELRAACDEAGALLIADEIWTGLGRSGALLASIAAGVLPDLICLGKGLGNGFPVSACIGRARAMEAWGAHGGTTIHTATHFGWPPACAAASATLDAIAASHLAERAADVGERWARAVATRVDRNRVRGVNGRGLMVGVHVDGGSARALAVTRALLASGWLVLTGGTAGDVITLTPPLTIDEALLDAFVNALVNALDEAS
jgi:4-aminobutyrate aminotransferase/(S)-3-amino-2-methylpropionate transaminase